MNVSNFGNAKIQLEELARPDHFRKNGAAERADRLIRLMEKFPALERDEEAGLHLRKVTGELYSIKEHLSPENQEKIVKLFRSAYHLKPTYIHKLLESREPAEKLVEEYRDVEAVIRGRQQYPIPMKLLIGEKTPCNSYFKSIGVKLKSGETVRVSQGLLAHFSEFVQAMLRSKSEVPSKEIILDVLSLHEFDSLIAFLETKEERLINKENALPLLEAAAYLQIPELIEACASYLIQFLNDEVAVSLVNLAPRHLGEGVLRQRAERHLSEVFKLGLLGKITAKEFSGRLDFFKEKLFHPVKVSLADTNITDEQLGVLKDFPIEELDLRHCTKLSNKSLKDLSRFPSLKSLLLGGNQWINDKSLQMIPDSVCSLSLAACEHFSGRGLEALHSFSIKTLDLFGCGQLEDEELSNLPDVVSLDLSYCRGIGEQTLKRLGNMTSLRHLYLSETPVTEEGLSKLHHQLETLDLSGSDLDDGVFDTLSRMSELRELHLNGLKVTDQGLARIPSSVERLSLNGCAAITDEGVAGLVARENLQAVFLRRCGSVTGQAIEKFRPDVEVGWDPSQPSRMARRLAGSGTL